MSVKNNVKLQKKNVFYGVLRLHSEFRMSQTGYLISHTADDLSLKECTVMFY